MKKYELVYSLQNEIHNINNRIKEDKELLKAVLELINDYEVISIENDAVTVDTDISSINYRKDCEAFVANFLSVDDSECVHNAIEIIEAMEDNVLVEGVYLWQPFEYYEPSALLKEYF